MAYHDYERRPPPPESSLEEGSPSLSVEEVEGEGRSAEELAETVGTEPEVVSSRAPPVAGGTVEGSEVAVDAVPAADLDDHSGEKVWERLISSSDDDEDILPPLKRPRFAEVPARKPAPTPAASVVQDPSPSGERTTPTAVRSYFPLDLDDPDLDGTGEYEGQERVMEEADADYVALHGLPETSVRQMRPSKKKLTGLLAMAASCVERGEVHAMLGLLREAVCGLSLFCLLLLIFNYLSPAGVCGPAGCPSLSPQSGGGAGGTGRREP